MAYKHGTYGEFAGSIGGVATQSETCAVYVGALPVNLVRGYAEAGVVNNPVKLTDLANVRRKVGYSPDWTAFSLCEAIKVHFDNADGNAGPIVVINVLDPATHKKSGNTTASLAFVNGRATIKSDTIILDTLVLADKVEGTDYAVSYDWQRGDVVIESIGTTAITGTVQATYSEVDPTAIDKDDIIGGVTNAGVYTGLGCVELVYSEVGLVPNLIVAPGWSHEPTVYEAMIAAGTKINGHWDAFVLADIPVSSTVGTIEAAENWAEDNGYTSERSKICWPQAISANGEVFHLSTLYAWCMLLVDASHGGVPMETPSNKPVPVARQYFGANSTNKGFDQQRANELNAVGISTVVFWGGAWMLWGGHTAAYKFDDVTDNRAIFDNSIRMMMHITNSFQKEWALTIDKPMTLALAQSILNREQEKADALVAIGALIGAPVVLFEQSENPTSELVEGNFVWDFAATPTPQFKSGTMRVAYTDAGFTSYVGEV